MHNCQNLAERMVDLVFGELSEAERASVLAELERCPPCRAEYQSFKATLSTFDKAAEALLPDENYWQGYEARLQAKLAVSESPGRWQRWIDFRILRPAMLRPAWAVSITALLLIALFWFWFKQPTARPNAPLSQERIQPPLSETPAPDKPGLAHNQPPPATNSTGGEKDGSQKTPKPPVQPLSTSKQKFHQVALRGKQSGDGRQFKPLELSPVASISEYDYLVRTLADDETVRHFEKAQNLLRAFRNLRVTSGVSAGEIADERNRSKSLLLKNVLLRREAETRSNLPIEQVLSALEPLLIDIAHLSDQASPREIRAIHERIQRKEMIGKLQVYAARPLIAETTSE